MKIEQLPDENQTVEQETKNGDVTTEMVECGYNKENPPTDDCCPICFGPFHLACRTSCGHWFCSNCILQYWGYTQFIKRCKCPMCERLISKLVPHAPVLIQPTNEAQKILEGLKRYNSLNDGTLLSFYRKKFALPSWAFVRRRYRETRDDKLLEPWEKIIRLIKWELAAFYVGFDFKFFPYGHWGIVVMMELIILALYLFFEWDASRYHRELQARERLVEVDADENHLN